MATYPRRVPQINMSYRDMVAQRDDDFRMAGGIKSVRSAPPQAVATTSRPAVGAQASVNRMAAAAAPRGHDAPIAGIRRSPITNDASLEDKIADNARGPHMDADGRPARWNVPTQIEGRDVSTSGRLDAPRATAVTAPVAPAEPSRLPAGSLIPLATEEDLNRGRDYEDDDADLARARASAPAPQASRPVPMINIPQQVPMINIPTDQPQGYGGLMGAASAVRRAVPQIARDVASDVKSIVRQVPRALNYVAGGSRRLAEGDADRAQPSVPVERPIDRIHRRDEARRAGFSARGTPATPPGSQFTHGLQSRNPYTRRVFGDPLNVD